MKGQRNEPDQNWNISKIRSVLYYCVFMVKYG